jgi:2-phosphoglycerate kinase
MAKRRSPNDRRIVIRDEKHGLPYSKGLMASSIMATGLPPSQAYHVATQIEDRLVASKRQAVSMQDLRRVALETITASVGEEYAVKFQQWQALSKLDKPLVILIGGTTGVGKSTIASEMGHRLGITRIISTDAIREVMRAVFSQELMPALYDSSFNAWRTLRVPLPESSDPIIIGFREQASVISVGIKALIERAIKEGTNQIIEGVHIVPGFVDLASFAEQAFIIPMIITVDDEDLHRSHFYIRELETEGFRPFERYRANFDNIRKVGDYIEDLAADHKIPAISSHNLDLTVSVVLEAIIGQVIIPTGGPGETPTIKAELSQAVGDMIRSSVDKTTAD